MVYRGVKCTQFIGTIQASDLRITVHPKTSRRGDTQQWPAESNTDQGFDFKPFESVLKAEDSAQVYITNPKCAIGQLSIFNYGGQLEDPRELGKRLLTHCGIISRESTSY